MDWIRYYSTHEIEFAERFLSIVLQDKGPIPYSADSMPWHREYMAEAHAREAVGLRDDLIYKSRDIGSSTIVAIRYFVKMLLTGGSILVLGDIEDTTKTVFRIYRRFAMDVLDRLPQLMPHGLSGDNLLEVSFADKTGEPYKGIYGRTAGGKSTGRGDRFLYAHISEACFFENAERVLSGISGALIVGRFTTKETTPNGVGTRFSQDWHNETLNVWRTRHNWQTNPAHDEQWRKERDPALGGSESDASWAQEYNCDEIASGHPWINASHLPKPIAPIDLTALVASMSDFERQDTNPIYRLAGIKELEIWRLPGNYRVTSMTDTAEGLIDGDANATTALDSATGEQVYKLKSHLKPDEHAILHDTVARIYEGDHLVEMNNTSGGVYIATARALQTPGVIEVRTMNTTNPAKRTLSRNELVKEGERAIRLGDLKPRAESLIGECRLICMNRSGKYEAPSGYHDDEWISMLGAWYRIKKGAFAGGEAPPTAAAGQPSINAERW